MGSAAAQAEDMEPAGSTGQDSQFEVIDVSGEVASELASSSDSARESWKKACDFWKSEAKELNKTTVILGINCNQPSCSMLQSGAKWQCISTGTYKAKTPGQKLSMQQPPPVAPPLLPAEHVISVPPPAPIVEVTPCRHASREPAPASQSHSDSF